MRKGFIRLRHSAMAGQEGSPLKVRDLRQVLTFKSIIKVRHKMTFNYKTYSLILKTKWNNVSFTKVENFFFRHARAGGHPFVFYFLLVALFLFSSPSIYGANTDDLNEDDLFSDSNMVIETKDIVDDSVMTETDKPSLTLSGSIYNHNYYSTMRDDYILKNPYSDNDGKYTGSLTTNLLLDIRYKDGIKGFVNADVIYYFRGINQPGETDKEYTDQALREYFMDFNINNKVYFRLGRQYLKWGRNFFWNPTDLINVEKKDFMDPNKNLQGTRGIKVHMPFGTNYNIYGFINLEDLGKLDDIAWSGKFEFLVGSTEMAFSGWYKKGFKPVFGYDISTRLFHIDWQGEVSISRGENQEILIGEEDSPGNIHYSTVRREDNWSPKASLGFSKSYNVRNVNDRLTIRGEFFYNRSGYKDNVFNNTASLYSLLSYGLYEPNHASRYYGAIFLNLQRFIVSDAVLNLNIISNLVDGSGIIYSSFIYNLKYDFTINLTISSTFGNGRDEYTFAGNDKTIGLEFRYNF